MKNNRKDALQQSGETSKANSKFNKNAVVIVAENNNKVGV